MSSSPDWLSCCGGKVAGFPLGNCPAPHNHKGCPRGCTEQCAPLQPGCPVAAMSMKTIKGLLVWDRLDHHPTSDGIKWSLLGRPLKKGDWVYVRLPDQGRLIGRFEVQWEGHHPDGSNVRVPVVIVELGGEWEQDSQSTVFAPEMICHLPEEAELARAHSVG